MQRCETDVPCARAAKISVGPADAAAGADRPGRCCATCRHARKAAAADPRPALPVPASGLPPVVILGGDANALSVARSLRRLGAEVHALAEPGGCARHSRYCRPIDVPTDGDAEAAWARYLLGPASDHLIGAVLLACCDAGIQLLAHNREALLLRFRLDESDPVAQIGMLDKLGTYRHAIAAGVPTPRFWIAESRETLDAIRGELVFPLIVKPRLAHRAKKTFRTKHTPVADFDQLVAVFDAERAAAVDVVLMEWIPGGDDALSSYYTYLDADGHAHFDFTKRVIRRYPTGMGIGCYHVTDQVPEVREISLKLFRHVGLRGLANAEFKRDPRDGLYKLIECNARFTAANGLVAASGFDLAAFVYRRAVGLPQPPLTTFRSGMRVLDPLVDLMAFLELRRGGQLTLAGWLKSLLHRQTFAYFRWSDPLPAVARGWKMLKLVRQRKARPAPAAPAEVTAAAAPVAVDEMGEATAVA